MKRLLLVRHAPTAATKAAAFPLDERPDESALAAASRLAEVVPRQADACASPALRCLETARAAGLDPVTVPELAECDFGEWGGRSLEDVCREDPAGSEAWMTDPEACPHGGESLSGFVDRVAGWLGGEAAGDGSTFAITHGGVVKAAIVSALGAPLLSFWRVDVAPLSLTELHAHDGRWTLVRANVALEKSTEVEVAVGPGMRDELRPQPGAAA
ncbi:MAG TPA: histidine phosphatase family protein [Solirubrobacterales bacterium]